MRGKTPREHLPAGETRAAILQWLHFLYEAAVNPEIMDKTLGDVFSEGGYEAIATAVAPRGEGDLDMFSWKVWQLFSWIDARTILVERHPDLRDHPTDFLMGVMLHTVQDSY